MSLTPPAGLDFFQTGTWCKYRPHFDLQHRAASRWDAWSQLTVVQKTPNKLWMRGEYDPVGPRVSLCVWQSDYTPQLATLEAKSFSFALGSSQMSSRPLRLSQEELTHSTYVWGAWGRHWAWEVLAWPASSALSLLQETRDGDPPVGLSLCPPSSLVSGSSRWRKWLSLIEGTNQAPGGWWWRAGLAR